MRATAFPRQSTAAGTPSAPPVRLNDDDDDPSSSSSPPVSDMRWTGGGVRQ